MARWLTAADRDELAVYWPDSDSILDDKVLGVYLNAAKSACLAYAPALPRPADPTPVRVTLTDPDETFGSGTFSGSVEFTRSGGVVTATFTLDALDVSEGNARAGWFDLVPEPFRIQTGGYLETGGDFSVTTGDPTPAALSLFLGGEPAMTAAVRWLGDDAPADTIPDEWMLAQAMQARNLYNAAGVGTDGAFEGSGYGITAHPLDWQVKQLLRPRRGMGAIV